MPIKVAAQLSAKKKLNEEGIITINSSRAFHQDIRPLKILVLNLMPLKKPTEIQLLRLLGNSPLQVEVDFACPASRTSTHTDNDYLHQCYITYDDIKDKCYDGFICTGAPVEKIAFEDVAYWQELSNYFEWAKFHVFAQLNFCWSAQAALYYNYGIKKTEVTEKIFGIFPYTITHPESQLFRGFDDQYYIPQSRHTIIDDAAVDANEELTVLSRSRQMGINIISSHNDRQLFVMGHFEYDRESLAWEYDRDKNKGLPVHLPLNYYPNDDDTKRPIFRWCSCAHLFYNNWLNFVYQETPYNLDDLLHWGRVLL